MIFPSELYFSFFTGGDVSSSEMFHGCIHCFFLCSQHGFARWPRRCPFSPAPHTEKCTEKTRRPALRRKSEASVLRQQFRTVHIFCALDVHTNTWHVLVNGKCQTSPPPLNLTPFLFPVVGTTYSTVMALISDIVLYIICKDSYFLSFLISSASYCF